MRGGGEERGLQIAAAGRLAGALHFTRAGLPFIHLLGAARTPPTTLSILPLLTRLDRPEDSQRTLTLEIETFRIVFFFFNLKEKKN